MEYKGWNIRRVTSSYAGGIQVTGYEATKDGKRILCSDAEMCRHVIDVREGK